MVLRRKSTKSWNYEFHENVASIWAQLRREKFVRRSSTVKGCLISTILFPCELLKWNLLLLSRNLTCHRVSMWTLCRLQRHSKLLTWRNCLSDFPTYCWHCNLSSSVKYELGHGKTWHKLRNRECSCWWARNATITTLLTSTFSMVKFLVTHHSTCSNKIHF